MAQIPEEVGGESGSWQRRVLRRLDAPVNSTTLISLSAWARSEGMNPRYNNWLATTIDGYGGRNINSVGVKAFPSVAVGVAATVATLKLSYYTEVVAALRRGRSAERIWFAINQSPWCSGCQNGLYPVVLYNYLHDPKNVGAVVDPPPRNQAAKEHDWSPKVRVSGDRLERPHVAVKLAGRNLRRLTRRRDG